MRIIQLDDSSTKRMDVQAVLRQARITGTFWAQSVEEGIQEIKAAIDRGEPYDVAISDMHFPILKDARPDFAAGPEFVRQVKELGINLPVIVLSSSRKPVEGAYAMLWYHEKNNWEMELLQILRKLQ